MHVGTWLSSTHTLGLFFLFEVSKTVFMSCHFLLMSTTQVNTLTVHLTNDHNVSSGFHI